MCVQDPLPQLPSPAVSDHQHQGGLSARPGSVPAPSPKESLMVCACAALAPASLTLAPRRGGARGQRGHAFLSLGGRPGSSQALPAPRPPVPTQLPAAVQLSFWRPSSEGLSRGRGPGLGGACRGWVLAGETPAARSMVAWTPQPGPSEGGAAAGLCVRSLPWPSGRALVHSWRSGAGPPAQSLV